ncbi:MAG: hypothetical protein GY749_34920 [Desulfobacteraceae bacterium]|nr:hypothetical protein [Desulfobacteraceae bacterium]
MAGKKKKSYWNDIEKKLNKYEKKQLIDLLSDLYQLSSTNKIFLNTRFSAGDDPLVSYKRIIQKAIHPYLEDNEPLEMEIADDAIRQYCKATDNPIGEAELRIFYMESGNNFTLSYGDIDEDFYESLLEMYEYAIETVLKLSVQEQNTFRARLHKIMKSASGIGWGYYDGLCDLYYKAFPED